MGKAQTNNSTANSKRRSGNSGKRNSGKQSRKDSSSKRVNYDNARVDKIERQIKEDGRKAGANDIAWYSRNPELLKSAGSLPFATITGDAVVGEAVPGVCEIRWVPAFGSGVRPIALNQASDAMYSFIVHANSRDYSATAPDYMIVTIAGMQIYAMIAAAIRAFGTLKYYNERNAYLPDALVRAMGFNPIDLRRNLSAMWFDINNFIDQSRQIWIPNTMPLLERWYWLNSHIFQDAEGERSQKYVFHQAYYLTYDESHVTTGGALVPLTLSDNINNSNDDPGASAGGYLWSEFKQLIQKAINNLISAEDRGMMYGNMLNAYGSERMYMLDSIPADYVVMPEYNTEVLLEIENMVGVRCRTWGLVQIEEDLYPVFETDSTSKLFNCTAPEKAVLNFHIEGQPSPELVMIATRFSAAGTYAFDKAVVISTALPNEWTPEASTPIHAPYSMGSESVTSLYLWRRDASVGAGFSQTSVPLVGTGTFASPNAIQMMAFDWHPFVYQLKNVATTAPTTGNVNQMANVGSVISAAGDYDNFIAISPDECKKLHDTAMFSLFGVPIM